MTGKRAKKRHNGRIRAATKGTTSPDREVAMVPETNVIRVPDTMQLVRRPVCSPRSDEVPTLRDAQGRVLAQVECWTPEHYTAASRPS